MSSSAPEPRNPSRDAKSKSAENKPSPPASNKTETARGRSAAPPPAPPAPVAALFRRTDWLAFAITTVVVMLGYYWTLAPDLTLEDSGELAVGSFYAGVPHPPGYPVWTIYTWLFTVLFPFSNIAWRVGLSSAVAGAFSCGLLALLVSRGSSMMLEGISDLKAIEKKVENLLCIVAGFVAGTSLAFNGFMWSQSVIVEVYSFSVLSFVAVFCYLLRWIYAPHQLRYLYWASFMFGICITNHQTLIVAAMGIEVAVLAAQPKIGRDLFLANSAIYVLGLIAKGKGIITSFDNNPSLFAIYNLIGLGSLGIAGFLTLKTKQIFTEWKAILIMGVTWLAGAAFYFYMPLASMTNPPMNWGYPRTEEGFWHALTRGQYDKTNPTSDVGRLFDQARMYVEGAVEEYNFVYLLIGLIPFFFFRRMQKREKAWLIGLTTTFLCVSALLMMLLNPSTDRQAREQARVFFIFSHLIISLALGYGLSLIGGVVSTRWVEIRRTALWAAAAAAGIAIYALVDLKSQFPLDKITAVYGLALSLGAVGIAWICTKKAPMSILIGLFALMPGQAVLSHWSDNEQRGHLFGYWFGHDMFTPPFSVYPEMSKDAVLFGGTDPGRFAPTYMIFCESFIPPEKKPLDPKFDRRDVYLITQNALADGTYLSYIRAHYNRSTQIDPPFFVEFFRSQREAEEGRTNLLAKMFVPVDRYFTDLGARMEARRRKEGVYPLTEIHTPSPEESQKAFQDYIADAQKRLQHDMQFPNEPKQIKPGEDVRVVDNRISVSGQVAVMAINGLLTKVIFDANPNHEFYVEESFPLDWMFPHLTPFGIIMKINREPVREFTDDILKKDHEFWSKYSDRLIGNWITYDTPVKDICAFSEHVFLRRDFRNFKGDPKFVRDDNAQKAFSKLRSAIGGVYFWRLSNLHPNSAERDRLFKEAEFAYKQALAYCPYSPEAVFKYVNLLVNLNRAADAKLIVETCLKFDPENGSMVGLLQQLQDLEKGALNTAAAQSQVGGLEQQLKANPTNVQLAFQLASLYLQLQRKEAAVHLLEQLAVNPQSDMPTLVSVAEAFRQLSHWTGVETVLRKVVAKSPGTPEYWFELARTEVNLGKTNQALQTLARAIQLSNQRLITTPGSKSLVADALTEPVFATLRQNPEFIKLVATNK